MKVSELIAELANRISEKGDEDLPDDFTIMYDNDYGKLIIY